MGTRTDKTIKVLAKRKSPGHVKGTEDALKLALTQARADSGTPEHLRALLRNAAAYIGFLERPPRKLSAKSLRVIAHVVDKVRNGMSTKQAVEDAKRHFHYADTRSVRKLLHAADLYTKLSLPRPTLK